MRVHETSFERSHRSTPQPTSHASPAVLEPLEPRVLLSGTSYLVDSLADVVASDSVVTLREAIEAANANSAVTADVLAGSATEFDIITFDQAALAAEASVAIGQPVTIMLGGTQLEITDDLEIQGLGASVLTVDAGGQSRALSIATGETELKVTGLTITRGYQGISGRGGGIYNSGTLVMANVTVAGNSVDAFGLGGGIYSSGTLVMANSMVLGNSAHIGGGINNFGTLVMANSTVTGNTAYYGGGIRAYSGTATLNNTIVALNDGLKTEPDIAGPSFTSHHSLVGVDPGFVRNPSAGADDVWGTADDDYGDLRLRDTSIAINLGDSALAVDADGLPLAADLAGNPRVVHGQVDVGAFEYQGAASPLWESPSTAVTTLADVVDTTDGQTSLREAFAYTSFLAQDVTFAAGFPGGTIVLDGRDLCIYQSLSVDATSIGGLTIDAAGRSRVLSVTGGVEVSLIGLRLTGGSETGYGDGGGICNSGVLTLTNSTVSGNSLGFYGGSGGGIYNAGTLTLTNSTVASNSAGRGGSEYGGGGIRNVGTLTLTNSTVSGNSAGNGGGIWNNNYRALTLNNTIVALNDASIGTDILGAFTSHHSLVGVDPGFVRNPSAGADGAWGTADDDYGDLRLRDTSIAINLGDSALAVDADGLPLAADLAGNPRVVHGQVDVGAFEYQGAASPLWESPSTVVTTLADVMDTTDGQISLREAFLYAGLLAQDVTFAADLSDGTIVLGGRELHTYQSMTVDATSIGGLTIDASGQSCVLSITNGADVSLIGLRLTRGSTTGYGGGIYNESGTLTLTNCMVVGNSAQYSGGGIYSNRGTLTLTNSTVVGNSARDSGGGIYSSGGTLTLTNSTVVGNSTRNRGGGGILFYSGPFTLNNTIVALNDSPEQTDWSTITGTFTSRSSLLGVDPGFIRNPSAGADGAWGTADDDYGDLRLRDTSIAINLGDSALAVDADGLPLTADLGGNPRVAHGQVDVGAFEYQGVASPLWESPSTVVTTLADVVDTTDGQTSLREAIVYAGLLAQDVTFAAYLSDGTIVLAGRELHTYQSMTVDATSIGGLTIDAAGQSRVLSIADGADVSLIGLRLTRGSTTGRGGGIYLSGTLTLTNATVSGNCATEVVGLSPSGLGGGIYIERDDTLTLTNTMVVGNSAHYGGGIHGGSGTLTLTNSTVAGNSADGPGGGINSYSGPFTLNNTIVALNDSPEQTDISGDFTNNSSLVGIDPDFIRNPSAGADGAWGTADDDYGDLRLLPTSPAIDAGDNALLPADEFDLDGDLDVAEPLPIDLAGNPRIYGGTVDIGAYECVYSLKPNAVDLLPASDTGALNDDNITNLDNGGPTRKLVFDVGGTVAGATVTIYADGVAIGSAVAEGTTTTVTTDGLHGLVDGPHVITARQTEPGNVESADSAPLSITVDTVAPQVTQVFAAGTAWTAGFFAALGDDRGWAVPDGVDQLKSLPWPNLDEFKIVLDEEVVVANDDLGVYGVDSPAYATDAGGFSYPDPDGPAGLTATWKLTAAVPLADKLLLVLSSDSVTDLAGNALDGEWANGADTYNSGDGVAGGDFAFRVNILPGDVNQSGGRVTALDWILTRARTNLRPGDEGYEPLYDSNGSGGMTALDWILARVRTNTQLPVGEPTRPITGVSAAASSQLPHTPAGRLLDGSGLLDGLHSTSYTDMWLSEPGASPTVQFDLGATRTLTSMHVWNYNQVSGTGTPLTNRGVRTADVYVSTTGIGDPGSDPTEWTLLADDLLFAEATGQADYAGQLYELSAVGVEARYVLLTNVTNWGGTNTGLSEVRFRASS